MKRRSYVLALTGSATALCAGCVSSGDEPEASEEPDQNSSSEDDGQNTATSDADEHPALTIVEEYITAATEQDIAAVAKYMHSAHPFNPDNLSDEETQDIEFSVAPAGEYELERADEAFDIEALRAELSASPWFEDSDGSIAEITDGERTTLVEVVTDGGADSAVTETTQLIMLTENGKWRVLLPYDQSTNVPDDAGGTGEYQVVDHIEYDTETGRAKVYFSGVGEVTAEELTVYSESLGEDSRLWSEDSDTLPGVTFVTAPFDTDGDQLIVTVTVDGEETVIYRDQYPAE